MKCKYCGNDLLSGASFCEYCGARVIVESQHNYWQEAGNVPNNQYTYEEIKSEKKQEETKKVQGSWPPGNSDIIDTDNISYDDNYSKVEKDDNVSHKDKIKALLIYALIMLVLVVYNLGKMSLSGHLTWVWLGVAPLIFYLIGIGTVRNVILTICGFLNTLFMNHFLFGKYSRGIAELVLFILLLIADQLASKYIEKYRTDF